MIYSKGSTGAAIGIIQNNLRMLGYDPKGIDCIFGENTEIAVKKFQSATGLIPDGIVGLETLNALFQSYDDIYSIDFDISQKGIDFIADYESFYATPYRGLDFQNKTIGYGHVIISSENFQSLTETEAKSLLKKDLQGFVDSVNIMTTGIILSQNQFDALISFAYNCGASALKGSTLLNDIKAKAPIEKIKEDFLMWCNCNGKPALGLYRRRYDEFEIYSNADYTRTYREF